MITGVINEQLYNHTTTTMNIQIVFGINANKFFQTHFRNDYYPTFSEEERGALRDALRVDRFRDTIKLYTSNHGDYHGKVDVVSVEVFEDVFEEEDHLFVRTEIHATDPNELGFDGIKALIEETVSHYFPCGPAGGWGNTIYYTHNPPNEVNFDEDEDSMQEEYVTVIGEEKPANDVPGMQIPGHHLFYLWIRDIGLLKKA